MFNFKKTKRIYLDTGAATPVDQRVFKVMAPFLRQAFGNPSSIHQEGVEAFRAKENARKEVADVLKAHPDELYFTSGGTEADNMAIFGIARGLLAFKKIPKPGHIIVSAIEHQAVLEPCLKLEQEGWRVTRLAVNEKGLVEMAALKEALSDDTVLLSIIYANNEIGTIQPIREIAKELRHWRDHRPSRWPLVFHTDACQAPRFLPLDVAVLGVQAMTINGSKIYGPKGVGCLYLKRGVPCEPIIYGGGQEKGLRSGTENVAGIVGLAKALSICESERAKESERLARLRDYFIIKVRKGIPDVLVNGDLLSRLPNNVNITIPGIFAELLLLELDYRGVACSTGSACSYHSKDESHVLVALGHTKDYADSTLRFSLGRDTTKKDIDFTVDCLKKLVSKAKKIKI